MKRNGAFLFAAAGTMAVLVAGCGGGGFGEQADAHDQPKVEVEGREHGRQVERTKPVVNPAPPVAPTTPAPAPKPPAPKPPVKPKPPVDPAPPVVEPPVAPPAPPVVEPPVAPPIVPFAPLTDARVESATRAYLDIQPLEAPVTGYVIVSVATASSGQWGKAVVQYTTDAGNVDPTFTFLVGNRGDYAEVADADWDPGFVGCGLPISAADQAELHVGYDC